MAIDRAVKAFARPMTLVSLAGRQPQRGSFEGPGQLCEMRPYF